MASPAIKKAIQIYARLKPMPSQQTDPFPYEIEPIDIDGTNDEILVINMKTTQNTDDGYYAHRQLENHRFRYSKVFDRASSQEEIFELICKPVIDGALAGYNGTIFAYGQTGSGKTYTMTGSRATYAERGIIPRTLSYIFDQFKALEGGMELQAIYVSYLEIYNENGYDLLHPGMESGKLEDLKKVLLMEDSQQQIHLKHLSVNPVSNVDQAMHLFYLGEHNRTIAETPMNEASTRSHCVFTIHVHTRETSGSLVRRSKIHLVDLAGSERISNSSISGQLFNEARHINLALHYLEQVIVALGEANRIHIPYRNSMMTSILRDSLGGNCMTSMIATLSLENRNIPETLSTCRFSQRVALVTNDATLNEEVDPDLLIAQLKAEIKRLKSVMSVSVIKPLTEDSHPLNESEFHECCAAVQEFLMDPDDDSLLTISPDMRLVQQCFQCLKCACNESHMKINNAMEVYKYAPNASVPLLTDHGVQQLLNTLSSREKEIGVLSRMLKEAQEKTKLLTEAGANSTTGTSGSGKKSKSKYENDPTFVQLKEVTEKLVKPPYSPPVTSRPLIDKESLLIEGFSDRKKEAWDNFLNANVNQDQLTAARNGLLQYREEVVKIKEEMNEQHETLNGLKRSMMATLTSNQNVEITNTVYNEAYTKHEEILARKEKRLLEATDHVNKQENILKSLYAHLLDAFESDHKEESQLKYVAAGVFKRSDSDTISMIEYKDTIPTRQGLVMSKPWMDSLENTPPKITCPNKKADKKEEEEDNQSSQSVEKSDSSENLMESKSKSKSETPKRKSLPVLKSSRVVAEEIDVQATGIIDNNSIAAPNDEDKDKNCPMTGNPACDKEILNFLRKRQAVFKRISSDGPSLPNVSSQPASRSCSNESVENQPSN